MPRRLLVWLILTVVGLTVATHYLGKLQRGAPAMGRHLDRGDGGSAEPGPAPPRSEATVYRWRDAGGTVHYESRPPPPGVKAEVLTMSRESADPRAGKPRAGSTGAGASRAAPAAIPGTPDGIVRQLESTLEILGERQRAAESLRKQP